MNFNTGDWIVKALELFEKSKILRRMYYAGIAIGVLFGFAAVLSAVRWW